MSSLYKFRTANLSKDSKGSCLFLYNTTQHLLTQRARGWKQFKLLRGSKTVASISFNVRGTKGCSPFRAPFGGFEIYDLVPDQVIETWWHQCITESLRKQGVKKIDIKSPPKIVNENLFSAVDNLMQTQHATRQDEVASVLSVDGDSFKKKISAVKRQRLEKNRVAFSFKKIPLVQVGAVYRFLSVCRKERGHQLSLTLPVLRALSRVFPRHIMLFGVQVENEWAAQAVVVRESKDVWYTFYYGHLQKFNKQSPTVFLMDHMYRLAQSKGVRWINMGTSMLDGEINRPLLHFKESIGAKTTIKRTYQLHL
ncbi:MAG: hypothetical protein ACKODM_14385 [Cytophagales bacterium]